MRTDISVGRADRECVVVSFVTRSRQIEISPWRTDLAEFGDAGRRAAAGCETHTLPTSGCQVRCEPFDNEFRYSGRTPPTRGRFRRTAPQHHSVLRRHCPRHRQALSAIHHSAPGRPADAYARVPGSCLSYVARAFATTSPSSTARCSRNRVVVLARRSTAPVAAHQTSIGDGHRRGWPHPDLRRDSRSTRD